MIRNSDQFVKWTCYDEWFERFLLDVLSFNFHEALSNLSATSILIHRQAAGIRVWWTNCLAVSFLLSANLATPCDGKGPGVVNQWFPIDWLQSIQSIIINNNPLIVIDWCNQSIKIDTHTRSLNCYWLPLITIENHWLIIHYATFWRVLAWACFIGPGHIYTSRVIG